jgi:hypothetical protein
MVDTGVMVFRSRIELKIGSISATCAICGAAEFVAPSKRPRANDVVTCKVCGTKFTYAFLLQRILRKLMEHRPLKAARKPRRRKKRAAR